MSDSDDLERFKKSFCEDYVFPHLNRLLDLQNKINAAETIDDVRTAMEREQKFLKIEYSELLSRTDV